MKAVHRKLNCQTDGEGGRGALFLSLVQMSERVALANGYSSREGGGSTRRSDSGVILGQAGCSGSSQLPSLHRCCHKLAINSGPLEAFITKASPLNPSALRAAPR